MKEINDYDIVIIGAGPAGISASMHLCQLKIKHVLIDKAVFPRDKICGDAISGKVSSILKNLHPDILTDINAQSERYMPSWGVIFSAPNGDEVSIPFKHKPQETDFSPGYIVKRLDFDSLLLDYLDAEYVHFLQGQKVLDVELRQEQATVRTKEYTINCELVLSAEGTNGIVAKKYNNYTLEPDHFCAGLRAYYHGIKDLSEEGYIELHFVKESLPGYFWIFPLPNGEANVGIGMLSSYISKHKVDLKDLMVDVINSEKFKSRFETAELKGNIKGWGLPLGSKRRPLQGNRFMLLGDAASLIDPFTGEGIGNAMISGKIAANVIASAYESQDLDLGTLQDYEKLVYNKLWSELRLSRIMQKLIRYPWLFNWIIRKIKKNDELKKTITFMFEDVNLRKQFSSPAFYLRLLFNKA